MGDAFYGLHPRWLKTDQLYRIYITPDLLCGAYIAGQFQDERSAALQLQGLQLFFGAYVRRLVQRRADLEDQYNSMDPCSSSFLSADDRNFQIQRCDVAACSITHKRRLWTSFNTGTLKFTVASGHIRQFILVGDQNAELVADSLRTFCPCIEESGEPLPSTSADAGA